MPLDDATIDTAFQRYRREYDCYEKLARLVANKCEREIIRANTLRAAVTFRAKAPQKLLGKLQTKYRNEQILNTADEALLRVTDLAGVRISTYLEQDRARVVEEIGKLFDGPGGTPVDEDKKDAGEKFYRATHCQVALRPDDLTEENDNLDGLTCEIQVCSLLAHVWNELEHDLIYKPKSGELSLQEKESLRLLGHNTLCGDLIIKQLFDANEERIKQAQDESSTFSDVYDFVARTRDVFPACRKFGDNAGQLFENMVSLGFDTPTKVRTQFLMADYQERSQKLLEAMQQALLVKNDDIVSVEPESSDALLVLLLDSYADQVVANNPMGRGKGRPQRIASFASRFKAMKEATSAETTTATTM
jgi:ppGpp synthetase/RelA/SpoT-type nucleotidyltranferase